MLLDDCALQSDDVIGGVGPVMPFHRGLVSQSRWISAALLELADVGNGHLDSFGFSAGGLSVCRPRPLAAVLTKPSHRISGRSKRYSLPSFGNETRRIAEVCEDGCLGYRRVT